MRMKSDIALKLHDFINSIKFTEPHAFAAKLKLAVGSAGLKEIIDEVDHAAHVIIDGVDGAEHKFIDKHTVEDPHLKEMLSHLF